MAAGATYSPISTTTLGSAQASVTFTSFGGYTDLVLVIAGKTATSNIQTQMQFNSDSGSNYSTTYLIGDGTSALSDRDSNTSGGMVAGFLATATEGNNIFNIQNYANTTTYKTVLARANRSNRVQATVNLWRNTAAITTILVQNLGGQNFASGSTFTLYGIAAA
jgi:hypothetical protein